MPEQIWTVGIVGCGRIAGGHDVPSARGAVTTHAQAFTRHRQFALKSAVDKNQESLDRFQSVWGLPEAYPSVSKMLETSTPDVVVVCSPDGFHFRHAKELLEADRNPQLIIMEKPICETSDELRELQQLASQTKTRLIVNHTRRYDAAHQKVASEIRRGVFGGLLGGSWTYYGGWAHNGSHVVDTLGMMFGDDMEAVDCSHEFVDRQGDPNLKVSLLIQGAQVTLEPFPEKHYQVFESRLLFEGGVIRINDFGNQIVVEVPTVNHLGERVLIPRSDSPIEGLGSPIMSVVNSVASMLSGQVSESELGVDLDSAARTMGIIWKAQEMASSHDKVARVHLLPSGLEA